LGDLINKGLTASYDGDIIANEQAVISEMVERIIRTLAFFIIMNAPTPALMAQPTIRIVFRIRREPGDRALGAMGFPCFCV
jgi:hypothetical protein